MNAAAASPLDDKFEEWVRAGVLDAERAAALARYEAERHPSASASPAGPVPRPEDDAEGDAEGDSDGWLQLAAEAIGYVGAALVFAAMVLLGANLWDDLSPLGRTVALLLPTLLVGAAGWWTGRQANPGLQRLGSVLWLLAVAGVAAVAAEVWIDMIHDGDEPGHGAALWIGALTLVPAAAAWRLRPRPLQFVALFASSVVVAFGLADLFAWARDTQLSERPVGVILLGLGAVWLALGLRRWAQPAPLAQLAGGGTMLIGAQTLHGGSTTIGLWVGLLVAVTLLVIAVRMSELFVLFVAAIGLFQWTTQVALEYLEDTLGAEATLLVIGLAMIGVAAVVGTAYTRLRPAKE